MTLGHIEYDLAKELIKRAKDNANAKGYYHRYEAMKDYLVANYYKYIQAKCPFFTDHGEAHVNGVIWAASQLIGKNTKVKNLVSDFDLYLLLTAIIWHDAGMVVKRKGHEVVVQELIKEISKLAFQDVEERRIVEEIIAAHTGTGGFLRMSPQVPYLHYHVYPRALAAVLRLADEMSEDSSRISSELLERGEVPIDHRIYWYYAKSIKASHPEPLRERLVIEAKLNCNEAVMEFPATDGSNAKITLIEYVLSRFDKIVAECAFCAPQFARYASIQWVEFTLSLVEGTQQVDGYSETLRYAPVTDQYPGCFGVARNFFHEHPKWRADEIRALIQGG
jgi:hypothetical protein